MDGLTDGTQLAVHRGFPNPAADFSPVGGPAAGEPGAGPAPLALDFNRLLVTSAVSTFVLRLSGAGGQAHGILDGDLVIVDRGRAAGRRSLVIAWQDDEFILTERSKMPLGAQIWGTVTGSVRQYVRPN